MKIAVVGSGIAGLACADRLGRRHEVVLLEAESRLGGHAHTVTAKVRGEEFAVDTGFIVYNETTYPEFTRLLAELGVATQPAEMSFGLACERTDLEWSSRGLRGLFATRPRSLQRPFLRMLGEILRFAREAPAAIATLDPKYTLRELVAERGYSDAFRDWYLAPMGAAIWSAGTRDLLEMPAASFIRFFENHGLLGRGDGVRWRTLRGGSKVYVDALERRMRATIERSTPVLGITTTASGVEVATRGGKRLFDRVILAVHADTALSLLASPTADQRRVLGAIRYLRNETVLHTDTSLLPRRSAARASWNYRVPREENDGVLVTYDLSRLQGIPSAEPLLVTLNGSARIDPARVLARFDYAHPLLDPGAIDAQREHARIDGVGGIHFAGAYWRWGFHEDGLQSALRVVHSIEAGR
jgi:predicted NAD/FAD-binding protein